MPVLSCVDSGHFSGQVDIKMCGGVQRVGGQLNCVLNPVVNFQGQEDIICRRGLPEPFTTPWDEERSKRGDNPDSAPQQDERKNSIFVSVNDYWFKVFPFIRNRSGYYLIITDVNFKVRSGGVSGQVMDKSFVSGYCETEPYLYIFNPGTELVLDSTGKKYISTGKCAKTTEEEGKGLPKCSEGSSTSYSQFERSYVMGNLAFYVDGLPVPPGTDTNNSRFRTLRIQNYTVDWEVRGIFYNREGEQIGSLQKRGIFRTQRSSF